MEHQEVYDRVNRAFACEHQGMVLGFIICSNSVRQYRRWCPRCGHQTSSLKKSELPAEALATAIEIDQSVARDWWQRKSEQTQAGLNAVREKESQEWWANYNRYLQTPKWKAKREKVLKRDKYTCQACLLAQASEVHHFTYKHLFDEPLFELYSVCTPCHQGLTSLDRKLRGVSA